MSKTDIFNDGVLKALITNFEYENSSPRNIEKKIKKIYLEVTGEDLPVNIKAYTSDNELGNIRNTNPDSGFDGTILH